MRQSLRWSPRGNVWKWKPYFLPIRPWANGIQPVVCGDKGYKTLIPIFLVPHFFPLLTFSFHVHDCCFIIVKWGLLFVSYPVPSGHHLVPLTVLQTLMRTYWLVGLSWQGRRWTPTRRYGLGGSLTFYEKSLIFGLYAGWLAAPHRNLCRWGFRDLGSASSSDIYYAISGNPQEDCSLLSHSIRLPIKSLPVPWHAINSVGLELQQEIQWLVIHSEPVLAGDWEIPD